MGPDQIGPEQMGPITRSSVMLPIRVQDDEIKTGDRRLEEEKPT